MDDILTRMLEIERQAAAVVAEAESKAELIHEQSRIQVQAEQKQLRNALADEAKDRIAAKVAEAEELRRQALRQGEKRLHQQGADLRQKVSGSVETMARHLAYPTGTCETAD